jgi:hypothetical protein
MVSEGAKSVNEETQGDASYSDMVASAEGQGRTVADSILGLDIAKPLI